MQAGVLIDAVVSHKLLGTSGCLTGAETFSALSKKVVAHTWERYSQAKGDLFASEESAQCPLFYFLTGKSAPMGLDALVVSGLVSFCMLFPL